MASEDHKDHRMATFYLFEFYIDEWAVDILQVLHKDVKIIIYYVFLPQTNKFLQVWDDSK